MLFVGIFKLLEGKTTAAIAKRLGWQYPEGMNSIAEYWLNTPDPAVITIFEADSEAVVVQYTVEWSDFFAITIVPAITAEEGLELAKQMMG